MNYTKTIKINDYFRNILVLKNGVIMNEVFVQGKIISEINFDFIINSKNVSIVIFNIELFNKSIIRIKVYNELADYCYRKLNVGERVFVEGYLNSKIEIIAKNIKKLE